ncbi:MAG: ribonuclease G [bacterium]|jgi:ribonuclease G
MSVVLSYNQKLMVKEIIINHMEQEIRVAILENKLLTEIFYERSKDKSVVGNIFKGKVLKVLPGMESAFVDIGLLKAAFLYVDDIRIDREKNPELIEDYEKGRKSARNKRPNIKDLIKEGDELLVQVSKGPIGTKGARVTCNISLPGRNLVYMPYMNNVGVSRQIHDEKERNRLKQIVNKLKPANSGFIVRTVASRRSEDEFKGDIDYLINTWQQIDKNFQTTTPGSVVYEDLNLTFRTIRDSLSGEVDRLVIDDYNEYQKVKNYIETYLPNTTTQLRVFKKNENIFDSYGINQAIDRALSRKVWLKSGGYLVIDQSEALTSIDVNTGKFTGSDNHEETILQTNLESAIELVYQLKLRDMGGIIIIDFIDMEILDNRSRVYQVLKEELKKDKARSKILAISEIGLVEMTRKRSRENLTRFLCTTCPYCDGTGRIKSPATTVYEIYRDIHRISRQINPPQRVLLGVHPDIADYIETVELKTFKSMEKALKGSITLRTSEKFHMEQYEIFEL